MNNNFVLILLLRSLSANLYFRLFRWLIYPSEVTEVTIVFFQGRYYDVGHLISVKLHWNPKSFSRTSCLVRDKFGLNVQIVIVYYTHEIQWLQNEAPLRVYFFRCFYFSGFLLSLIVFRLSLFILILLFFSTCEVWGHCMMMRSTPKLRN